MTPRETLKKIRSVTELSDVDLTEVSIELKAMSRQGMTVDDMARANMAQEHVHAAQHRLIEARAHIDEAIGALTHD